MNEAEQNTRVKAKSLVAAHVLKATKAELQVAAAADRRSVSQVVGMLIDRYLAERRGAA